MSICIFMEMQWIHSGTIHTGEFFHGPFEVTDANTPFVIQVSEGSTRELDERCLKFLHTYAKRIEVLDAKELGRSSIPLSWTTSTTLCSTMSIPSTITPSLRPASIR